MPFRARLAISLFGFVIGPQRRHLVDMGLRNSRHNGHMLPDLCDRGMVFFLMRTSANSNLDVVDIK